MNCEEKIREKNEMGEEGCMYVLGEKKKERQEATWVVGKKKMKKEIGSEVDVYGGKKGRIERKKEKKKLREKTKLVLFVCSLCLVQSVKL